MNSIYSYTRDDFINYFININEKKFKADQLFDWLYKKRVVNFDLMNNLNKNVISKLKNDFIINNILILKKDIGKDSVQYFSAWLINFRGGVEIAIH